jgi:uncharacterized protein YgiM (DUF1202 family)
MRLLNLPPAILGVCLALLISSCSPAQNHNSVSSQKAAQPSLALKQSEQGQSSVQTVVVKSLKANLRDRPSRSGAIVKEVAQNDRLTLINSTPSGPWYRVRESQSGPEGWIHGDAISLIHTNQPIAGSSPEVQTETTRQANQAKQTDRSYINVEGDRVQSPVFSDSKPAGASARCRDGSYSFSRHRSGTCSHHGGVAEWF